MDRIGLLRKDIIQGIGIKLLKQAYDIMDHEDDEETEVCRDEAVVHASKEAYHFFRATHIKIQSIKMIHNWA